MTLDWRGKRVVVTGGAGFIGSHVVDNLVRDRRVPREDIVVPRKKDTDLRVRGNADRALADADVVLHLAADIGGLGYSKDNPATQYHDCTLLDLNVVEAARKNDVEKTVLVSSACAYPRDVPYPLMEDDIFAGLPQETNRAYGFAKRMEIVQAEAYAKQYGMDIAVVVCANAYGPRDHFDLATSHVIPALLRKCLEQPELVVWGDGSATRDFLYVEDFAEGVLLAAERLDEPLPVNIGTGRETSIRELVETVVKLTQFKGPVRYDATKPQGQPKRVLSIERARKMLGYEPRFTLEEGLHRTLAWYRDQGAA